MRKVTVVFDLNLKYKEVHNSWYHPGESAVAMPCLLVEEIVLYSFNSDCFSLQSILPRFIDLSWFCFCMQIIQTEKFFCTPLYQ